MTKPQHISKESGDVEWLPDFCQAENNFLLILVVELIAVVIALIGQPASMHWFIFLALVSLYLQWIALSSAALHCLLLKLVRPTHVVTVSLLSLGIVIMMTVIITAASWWLNQWLRFPLFTQLSIEWIITRHALVALILYGLALRYFYLHANNLLMLRQQGEARLKALQARIRPHFLFNSLNTIANLTHDDPQKAEESIVSLADLFRASLKSDVEVTLEEEINLAQEYMALEDLRLGKRLQVCWQIEPESDLTIKIPALTLQPLLENAVYHGIEPQLEGGCITLKISVEEEWLRILISNPLPVSSDNSHTNGNRMAVNNIKERLHLAYHGLAKFKQSVENDLYTVVIDLPKHIANKKGNTQR